MQPEILNYLRTQKVGVLAVEMLDGSPHGATVHFANTEDAEPIFFFETNKEYKKSEALFGRASSRASFVVGADESNAQTLQMDGEVRLLKPEEQDLYNQIYFGKFPKKKEKSIGPSFVTFMFIPKWWRFSDWTRPEGKLFLTSEDK